jgi:peptidoglycan/LPS O-acetylase OafA/YrhL
MRAVAVTAVVLYHAAVPGFNGGYVGVDVFFVISGYLITQLLVRPEHRAAREQLADFYLRRGRRILPALAVVSVLAAFAALLILLPSDLRRFGRYLTATTAFVGNIAARTEGYFANDFSPQVLMHLWSIGVEEQFYLAYPILMLLLARFVPRNRLWILSALAAASFGLCVWASTHVPVVNYYFPVTRAWELLLGAIVALSSVTAFKQRALNEALTAASLAILAVTFFSYDSSLRYPGALTLAPCVATACLLGVGQARETTAARFLSLGPIAFTGLISYSLYLWHWPILAFFRYYFVEEPGLLARCSLIAATYLVAAVSWKAIEQPIRTRAFMKSNRTFVTAAVSFTAVLLAVGIVLWSSQGFPGRFSERVQAVVGTGSAFHPGLAGCVRPAETIRSGDLCRFGSPEAPKRVVVWGDSHAMALLPAYEKLALEHDAQLYFAVTAACAPLLGVVDDSQLERTQLRCVRFNDAVVEALARLDPALVILNAYWAYYDVASADGRAPSSEQSALRWGLGQTLSTIESGKRSVCVVEDVPILKYLVPHALAMALRRNVADDYIAISREAALHQGERLRNDLHALQAHGASLTIADPKDVLCAEDSCAFQARGLPLYRDTNHLNMAGAAFVSSTLEPCFAAL